jgi:hypothetical protein
MDQSFNDQELSDIMKEIEALEEDFEGSTESDPGTALEELAQLEEGGKSPEAPVSLLAMETLKPENPSMKKNFSEKKTDDMKVSTSTFAAPASSLSASSTAIKFKVSGNLSLDLELEMGEQVVSLNVSESGLSIEMDGGVKFTIPNQVKAGHKKAG